MIVTEQIGDWHFKARPARLHSGFLAWCAKTPALGDGPLDVDRDCDVYASFGDTAEAAIAALKREVLQ